MSNLAAETATTAATTADGTSRQPNGRPISTIARSFSAVLDNAFLLNPELDNLSQSVAQKHRSLSTQKSELESLEARLRETEARLRDRQSSRRSESPAPLGSVTARRNNTTNPHPNNTDPSPRPGLKGAFDSPPHTVETRGWRPAEGDATRYECDDQTLDRGDEGADAAPSPELAKASRDGYYGNGKARRWLVGNYNDNNRGKENTRERIANGGGVAGGNVRVGSRGRV